MTARIVRFRGLFSDMSRGDRAALFQRAIASELPVRQTVTEIITRVRRDGDVALRELARELDHIELPCIEVPSPLLQEAFDDLPTALRRALERSAANIERYHQFQLPSLSSIIIEPGIEVTRRADPFRRVGVYAPGGLAAYPSSVLMGAIPAKVAGVEEVVLCTPPVGDGYPDRTILAAAHLSGIDRVFAIGGAGAIAAMCIGTATIPRVDKVVGPGNAYVAEAKLQLANMAAFDSPAGPSELLIIADDSATPHVVVREMLAQAEHDPLAAVVLVAIGASAAAAVEAILETEIAASRRAAIIRKSLSARGAVIVAATEAEAVAISNEFAPEHLLIATHRPDTTAQSIRNAGTVFLGQSSSVAFGDYMTGANHVLPTGGLARSYSGLSTLDFIRWTSLQSVSPEAAARLASDVAIFAAAEGLHAHAAAALTWIGEKQ